ncbi:MAG: ATP-dependent helicase/nuclease subunit, partial [Verrucomicrobiota bacterium]
MAADGLDLILLAPKQATFQLERQLLAGGDLQGYTRLHIFSFERLARFIFEKLNRPVPQLLDEEGRVMVLRSLLAKKREHLQLFRASARLTGFAQQLSRALRELQRNQLTPESLNKLADDVKANAGLSLKLQDLATLLRHYLDWLAAHDLQDADCLLGAAAALASEFKIQNSKFKIS